MADGLHCRAVTDDLRDAIPPLEFFFEKHVFQQETPLLQRALDQQQKM